jgi:hypothetical protein
VLSGPGSKQLIEIIESTLAAYNNVVIAALVIVLISMAWLLVSEMRRDKPRGIAARKPGPDSARLKTVGPCDVSNSRSMEISSIV